MSLTKIPLLEVCENRTSGISKFEGYKEYLNTGSLDFDTITSTETITYKNRPSRANRKLKIDDVICARMQDTIKVLHIDNEKLSNLIVSTGFIVLHPSNTLLPKYLKYFLLSNHFNKEKNLLCNGATQRAINDTNLNKIAIPLPPLPEQKHIVEILEKADTLRKKRQEADEKSNTIIQSVFLQMFGDPIINLNNFKKIRLKEIIELGPQNGIYKSTNYIGKGDTILIDIKSLYRGWKVSLEELRTIKVTPSELEKYSLKNDDILINRVSLKPEGVGKAVLVDQLAKPAVFESNMMRIRLKRQECTSSFLVIHLGLPSTRKQLLSIARVLNQASINQSAINNLEIILPPISEQQKFAVLVQKVEKIKQKQQESKKEIDNLFNSLMQKVFSH